jgi:hypothetical protein
VTLMTKRKTAKMKYAVAFELRCPVSESHEVQGPDGSFVVHEHEFVPGLQAYCIDCHVYLTLPRIPKRVSTNH